MLPTARKRTIVATLVVIAAISAGELDEILAQQVSARVLPWAKA